VRCVGVVSASIWWAWLRITGVCHGIGVSRSVLRSERLREAHRLPEQSAVDLEPACGDFWDSLAAAYGANADFKRAVKCAAKAEKLADNPDARADYADRRKAFEKGQMPSAKREPDTQQQQQQQQQ